MLRSQYLGLHFGRTCKHLEKILHEVVPTSMMTYVVSFGVVKTYLFHEKIMLGCQRVGEIEAYKVFGVKHVII